MDDSLVAAAAALDLSALHPLHHLRKDAHNALGFAAACLGRARDVRRHGLAELRWWDAVMPADFPLKAEKCLSLALGARRGARAAPADAAGRHSGDWFAEHAVALCVLSKGPAYTRRLCQRHMLAGGAVLTEQCLA